MINKTNDKVDTWGDTGIWAMQASSPSPSPNHAPFRGLSRPRTLDNKENRMMMMMMMVMMMLMAMMVMPNKT